MNTKWDVEQGWSWCVQKAGLCSLRTACPGTLGNLARPSGPQALHPGRDGEETQALCWGSKAPARSR